jgi:hypothetical protein
MAKIKTKSRAERWQDAISSIEVAVEQLKDVDGVQDLKDLNSEYQDWKENIEGSDGSDGLMQGATYEKLEELENLDVESQLDEFESALDEFADALSEFQDADLPVGFGRD